MERSFAEFYEPSGSRRFKKLGAWLWTTLGIGAILGAYCMAVINEVAPAPQVAKHLVCEWREWWAEPAPGTQFTILISNLAHDSDGRQTNRVAEMFRGEERRGGLDVRRTCRVVVLDSMGGSLADAEAEAHEEGRALLADGNADLLIWGEVKDDRELSLWFLSAGASTFGAPSYSITEKSPALCRKHTLRRVALAGGTHQDSARKTGGIRWPIRNAVNIEKGVPFR